MQTMVVDSNDVMWIFGGSLCCGSGTFYNNLFTLNTATEVWAEVVATGSVPTSRRKHTAVMDSSDRMWVFAGELSDGTKTNELYYLETATPNWVQVTASGTLPSEREKHVAVMDSSDRMWVYGGHLGSSTLSDLQVLDTATETWTEVVAANTPPRRYFAVGVAGSPEVMWLWSGYNGGRMMDELHYLSAAGDAWTEVTVASSMPTHRWKAFSARDSQNRLWIFGGANGGSQLSDVWYLDMETGITVTTSSGTTSTSSFNSSTSTTHTSTSSSSTATSSSSTTTQSSSATSSSSSTTSSSSSMITSSSSTTTQSFSTTSSSSSMITSSSSTTTSSFTTATQSFGTTATTTSLSTTSRTGSNSSTSSSTSSSTMGGTASGGIAEVLLDNARSLIAELSSSNVSTALTPLGRMTAVKLTDELPESGFAMASTDGFPSVIFPTETLQNGSYDAVVLTSFDGEMGKGVMQKGASATSSAGNPLIFATDAVDISLFGVDLSAAEVLSAKPVFIKLATENLGSPLICAYQLEDGTWSTDGVRLATADELEQSGIVDTSGAWCATFHLSIFAMFVDVLLDCTNINVLSSENLREIMERSDWWTRPPSLCLWVLVAILLLFLAAGLVRDASRSTLWQAEYFFTEAPGVPQTRCCRCRCSMRCRKSQAPETPETLAAMKELKKKEPFSKMQESILCQNTLREVSLQHGLHTNLIQEHVWGAEGWIQGSLALQKSSGLKAAALRVKDDLPFAYVKAHSSRWRCWFSAFVTTHPLFEMQQFDLHVTAGKRAKIFMDCILGSLAFVALFFSVDGSAVAARSPEDCPIEQTSFLWLIFVSTFSIFLNFVPRSLFQCLAFHRFVHVKSPADRYWKLRIHQLKDLRFWALGLSLTVLQLLIIMAFLANLDPADEWKWQFSLVLVLARKLLLVPLVSCTISGVVSELGGVSKHAVFSPPKKFGLNVDDLAQFGGFQSGMQDEADKSSIWNEKVRELAGRGLTLRQLLDFYADLVGQPQMMPHFDPNLSTTHDVVRHAIIPSARHLREARHFLVQVHRAVGHDGGSDPGCALFVCRGHDEPLLKPWKGGSSSLRWDETVLLQEVLPEESLYFAARPQNKEGEEVFSILPSSSFWHGLRDVDIRLGAGVLVASIKPCDSLEEARAIVESRELLEEDEDMSENAKPNPIRLAISPGKAVSDREPEGIKGFAYATSINGGRPCLAQKMVTHSWGNKFCHLISAIFSDALEEETYDRVAQWLMSKDFEGLCTRLQHKKKLDVPYWVCAFSVNQHAGICARAPPLDSTGHEITVCSCGTAKHFEGDLSEMNKFDDMMAFLKQHHRQNSQVRLEQVVAMEVDFTLLTRVWCVAELVEADRLHLHQAVKTHSAASREKCVDHLLHLDVREAQASFPADKDLVLSKIEDVNAFNRDLQGLMLQRLGTFLAINQVTATAAAAFDDILGAVLSVLVQ
ncbi:unnamed protein product [Effrenium voratum]|nr:unnamed protein product [Effrenium voratum]